MISSCQPADSRLLTILGVTYQQSLFNYVTAAVGLGGLIFATEYPESGEDRITILP